MSQTQEEKHKAHFAAMAVLVAGGVIGRKEGIDALAYSLDLRPNDRTAPVAQPPGTGTARSMARLMLRGGIDYREAEHNVAMAITGGEYPDDFARVEDDAARLLGGAVASFERLRARVADRLQFVMIENGLAARLPARIEPHTATEASKPLELRQEAVEAPKLIPGRMAPRTVTRRPARPL